MSEYITKISDWEVSDMAQMTIYLEDKPVERLDKAVKAPWKLKSKWVADAVKYVLQDQWPEGFFDLAGKWEDDVGPGEIMKRIRKGMEELYPCNK